MQAPALTIAGSDPSGGAGLQADLKTFHQFGLYGMSVVTLLTVQNTRGVTGVQGIDPAFVLRQIDAVLEDIPPKAVKIGALGSAAMVETVVERLSRPDAAGLPLVLDPVMVSKHGAPLVDDAARQALCRRLLPLADVVTPNLHEAAALTGLTVDSETTMIKAAAALADLGAAHVVITGGALVDAATDILFSNGQVTRLPAVHQDTPHTHGTGCVFAAAVTAGLALGKDVESAVRQAKSFIHRAIQSAPGLGHGRGPVNMHVPCTDSTR
ncbi:bifunctional hydroxymethylpyrimidine kinase/phosphomethylpyrimidine kinase [Ectothiorhodospira shaposhnikovii]|uniref:bifunctional hydroxymethylpyrimidine kinase/phosphomethylpyrimidine kinase n=1 Tax=Ectothiorhodospira shaposhnikovii TaxID=1054 RepID=UPI001EE929E5|nr:bifunctional hydroxymethylpyrimidine kinase/phosphomethylpyrimidine kinase [Ectothiorhodospira shaposhnikovii]MCG5513956.1 bifunctional hydroxymethylpyrimidine kinase/phosphomethylpyrimidine kinase [Ectothiorhodospira shaposhnikovii]